MNIITNVGSFYPHEGSELTCSNRLQARFAARRMTVRDAGSRQIPL